MTQKKVAICEIHMANGMLFTIISFLFLNAAYALTFVNIEDLHPERIHMKWF